MKNYKKGFINVLVALSIGALAVVSGALIQKYTHPQTVIPENKSGIVGAVPTFTSGKVYTLYGGGISSTDTSIKLSSFLQPVSGQPILTADLIQGVGASFYITIEPSTNRKETVGCNVVTQNGDGTATLSGCTRGYMFTFPYTASTTLRLSHSGGSRVVMSDSPQLYNDLVSYINTITAAGVVDAGGTTKGIVESATAAEAASHAAVGSGNTSAPLVLQTNIASSSRVVNTSVVVVASSTTGYIDNSFISTSTLLYPIIMPSQTANGTTTVGTTTINSILPYGLLASTNATNTTKMTVSFPYRDQYTVQYFASSTATGGVVVRFNDDSSNTYIRSGGGGTGTTFSTSFNPSGRTDVAVAESVVMKITNPKNSMKFFHVDDIWTNGIPVTQINATTTAGIWNNQATPITTINIVDLGTSLQPASYIRVYGDSGYPF